MTGIELGTDAHWPDVLSSDDKAAMRDAVARNGWMLNIDYNMKTATLDNFDEAKVLQGISELKADLSLAEELGAGSVSVRVGLISSSLPDNVDEVRRKAQTNIADALREGLPLAERANALLLIENAQLRPLEVLETYEQYNQLVEEIGSSRVKFIFDLAHCHTFTASRMASTRWGLISTRCTSTTTTVSGATMSTWSSARAPSNLPPMPISCAACPA